MKDRNVCCKKLGKTTFVDETSYFNNRGFCNEYCFFDWVIRKLEKRKKEGGMRV